MLKLHWSLDNVLRYSWEHLAANRVGLQVGPWWNQVLSLRSAYLEIGPERDRPLRPTDQG